jgi:hypothetical protein
VGPLGLMLGDKDCADYVATLDLTTNGLDEVVWGW